MAILRTKCISTKVTDDEYATLEAVAGGQTLSAWTREVLLKAARPDPTDHAVLAEVLALRMILLNLHFTMCRGDAVTQETMQRLIERADQDKYEKAQQRLAPPFARGTR